MSRYCGTCEQYKDDDGFRYKWSLQCKECRKKVLDDIHMRQVKFNTEKRKAIIEKNKEKYYTNRYKCVCGSYISDGNPKERHEKTKAHKNYLEYGLKGGEESMKFLNKSWGGV